MNKKLFSEKNSILVYIISIAHFIVTFFTDKLVFEAFSEQEVAAAFVSLASESRVHYVICKLVLLYLIYFLWRSLYRIAIGFIKGAHSVEKSILPYALIYLIPIIGVLIFKLPEGFLSNDESLIFAEAAALNTYTWFYYLTTYYYIITMMLIPSWLGPILVKVALQVMVCGYCVCRMHTYLKNSYGKRISVLAFLMYLPFMMFPVLAYTTSAHRIPVYYLIYVLLLFKLAMDRLEQRELDNRTFLYLTFGAALITQWRTEGIYMAVLYPILLLLSYPSLMDKENISESRSRGIKMIAVIIAVQYIISIPQNGFAPHRMQDQADNRMGPFWAYTITNMYRNGLDLDKNSKDMEKIWRYLDKGTLQAINDDLRDINYEDVLILYYPGYTGLKEEAAPEDYNAYVEGCKSIFVNNIDVFLKTRWGAFCYAALPYHLVYDSGIKGLLFSIFKGGFYNLFIPCLLMLVFLVMSLIKKAWQYFFMLGGMCCHWFIVFVLAPASYFKYYLPVYMNVYFGLIAIIVLMMAKKMAGQEKG